MAVLPAGTPERGTGFLGIKVGAVLMTWEQQRSRGRRRKPPRRKARTALRFFRFEKTIELFLVGLITQHIVKLRPRLHLFHGLLLGAVAADRGERVASRGAHRTKSRERIQRHRDTGAAQFLEREERRFAE